MRSEPELSIDRRDVIQRRSEQLARALPPPRPACLPLSCSRWVLGGHFRFESNSHALIQLVESAYAGLPAQVLPGPNPEFQVALHLLPGNEPFVAAEPPTPRIQMRPDLVRATVDGSNYVVVEPAQRRAQVVASADMLWHPYHLRYELIEFAVFTLAARGLGLVPLHAACVGRRGRGLLLLGESGSGKSTLALHCLLEGLDLLAEDAVFVRPEDLLATGVPNYLHVRHDTLGWVADPVACRWIRQSPVIRRRSGVEKFEADLRCSPGRLAPGPMRLAGAVFVSDQTADAAADVLEPLDAGDTSRLLAASQSHALSQPGWRRFRQRLAKTGGYRLRRARHPSESVAALRRLLD